jgi:two-component system, chemotaxis family, sensor kinase CheA
MSDKLIDTFLNEANDLIIDIEKSLLELKKTTDNKECISGIFRAMHTLKGAAGMFGFELIKNITHYLENIYQAIREEKRVLDHVTIEITFRTVDQLRSLLQSSTPDIEPHEYRELLDDIQELDGVQTIPHLPAAASNAEKTFYINFVPRKEILRNGTNPLYLVDDLLAIGHGVALPYFRALPSVELLDAADCFIAFEVILSTEKSVDEIQSVFLFIDGDCELEIKTIASGNAIKDLSTEHHPFVNRNADQALGFDVIKKTIEKGNQEKASEAVRKSIRPKATNIRVDSDRLDDLMNLVSELVTTQARLSLFSTGNRSAELTTITENIEKITRRLRDNTFTMTLVPLDSLAVRFQRLVNDLSKELGKEIEFRASGLDTKIDKSMIEKLVDPILHLLRNCIDHGIESTAVRVAGSKDSKGTITIKSYYSGSNVVIEISDDGAGIDVAKVRSKAIAQGLIGAETSLSHRELTELIFHAGLSTANKVTSVSGRGVGMDVVKRNINEVRGEIEVLSIEGQGTTFIISLPLTLSILDGLLVKIGDADFIFPLNTVTKCYEVTTRQLESAFNNWIALDGERVPFIYLRESFGITIDKPVYSQVIIVPFDGKNVGIAVDKIIGEYQAVLKPLGQLYKEQDEFSGATILGDGSVALMLDTHKVIRKSSSLNLLQTHN